MSGMCPFSKKVIKFLKDFFKKQKKTVSCPGIRTGRRKLQADPGMEQRLLKTKFGGAVISGGRVRDAFHPLAAASHDEKGLCRKPGSFLVFLLISRAGEGDGITGIFQQDGKRGVDDAHAQADQTGSRGAQAGCDGVFQTVSKKDGHVHAVNGAAVKADVDVAEDAGLSRFPDIILKQRVNERIPAEDLLLIGIHKWVYSEI